ncbi:hypothetical protein B0T26DRAFT_742572 [Lasiosphaeria miniovina]|uniref:Mitochondrial carrier protein PET8 n=1 Tax=Lasiosphaeria miniovina TaxID=1954250 RepID=A0AA40A481_9PEZI|nr:uncharacterized protein B0T26DRAFT_742572 [Lasiosphaeria miniovina]KAK0708961.1 hypothetical protein B0T26DRAFT_742572 [Lasiosphaeria miniovina]
MSARTLSLLPTAARPASVVAARRAFMQSTRLGLKESNSQDPNPDKYDKHKQDSLAKQRQGTGHWKPELASDSEESIKADRSAAKEATSEGSLRDLQERTKRAAEEASKHGTSMRDGL